MKKVVTVVGARPQFVKASVVSRAFEQSGKWEEVIVHTGQHFDRNMSEIFFSQLGITQPKHSLGIHSLPHGAMTGRMLEVIESVLRAERPDLVCVYGDTNSTLAAALAAAKLHVPIAHVEAGVRAYDQKIPEEVNRRLTDHVSHFLFAPSQLAVDNLIAEKISPASIFFVGDVMYDAVLLYKPRAEKMSNIIDRLGLAGSSYLLATIHRPRNTDDKQNLRAIIQGLRNGSNGRRVVIPLHPRTKKKLDEFAIDTTRLMVIEPVGYLDMIALISGSELVLTDSGGLQKEAFFCGTPSIVVRPITEWPELVEGSWSRLVSPDALEGSLENVLAAGVSTGEFIQPFGDGTAAHQVVSQLDSV